MIQARIRNWRKLLHCAQGRRFVCCRQMVALFALNDVMTATLKVVYSYQKSDSVN